MDIPVQVSFDNMDPTEHVEQDIREKAEGLEKYFDHIITVRAVVEAPHRSGRKGNLYNVRLDISVPGNDLVVNKTGPGNHAHEDVHVAIRDAFRAAERQLKSWVAKTRQDVKVHEQPTIGKVARTFPDQGYGFVELIDGQEVYFHQNSVVGGRFDDLSAGDEVRLVIADDESPKGAQATTVEPTSRNPITL